MTGIMVPETCWASYKICNKYHLLYLVGNFFPHINDDARSEPLQINLNVEILRMWNGKDKGKGIPVQAWTGPYDSRNLRLPKFLENRNFKVEILRKMERLSALRTGLHGPHEISMVIIFVRGWVDHRATLRPGGLSQCKIQMTPSGIESAIFRLVTQCLNWLCHRVPDPFSVLIKISYELSNLSRAKYICIKFNVGYFC